MRGTIRAVTRPHLVIHFRGADADDHQLDMRRLGQALIGVDRLVTHGLVALETGKFLRGRQRRPLAMRAAGPTSGSLEVAAWLVAVAGVAQPLYQAYVSAAPDLVWSWVTSVLTGRAGETRMAIRTTEQAVEALNDANERLSEQARLAQEHGHQERMAAEEHRHQEAIAVERHRHQERMLKLATTPQMAGAAVGVVASVGRSCEDVVLSNDNDKLVIDEEMARAIRARNRTGEIEHIRVRVRGLSLERGHVQLQLPSRSVISGHVLDPLFVDVPNAYTEALARQSLLDVMVRPVLRDEQLHSYYVLGASLAEG